MPSGRATYRLLTMAAVLMIAVGTLSGVDALSGAVGASSGRATFSYAGAADSIVVPENVCAATLDVTGAGGGAGGRAIGAPSEFPLPVPGPEDAAGGAGADVHAALAVTPGETLSITVGGGGAFSFESPRGGGGGGASDIRQGGSSLDDRVVVAGGGGGGGGYLSPGVSPGTGGDGNGGRGGDSPPGGFGGAGGSATAGGNGGGNESGLPNEINGGLGFGGLGGGGGGSTNPPVAGGFNGGGGAFAGGGGGGGLYGGGGGGTGIGGAGAGGGGSSFGPPGAVFGVDDNGGHFTLGNTNASGGNGSVTIDWVECSQRTLAIQIPQSTIVEGLLGSEHLLGGLDVPDELRGKDCDVDLTALNNESLREGTDLIVRTGTAALTAHDVESGSDPVHIGAHALTLGDTVTLSVVLGAYLDHGAFSGSATVVVTCPNPADSGPPVASPEVVTKPPVGVDAVGAAETVTVAPSFTG